MTLPPVNAFKNELTLLPKDVTINNHTYTTFLPRNWSVGSSIEDMGVVGTTRYRLVWPPKDFESRNSNRTSESEPTSGKPGDKEKGDG